MSGSKSFPGVDPGRRRNMQANQSRDTKPEMQVRKLLHAGGYRYVTHERTLPGKPDIVFPAKRKIVEVRGCFWHGHGCSPLGLMPKSRTEYWEPKIAATKARDIRNEVALQEKGWQVLNVWECVVRGDKGELKALLSDFLGPPRTPKSLKGDRSAVHPISSVPYLSD